MRRDSLVQFGSSSSYSLGLMLIYCNDQTTIKLKMTVRHGRSTEDAYTVIREQLHRVDIQEVLEKPAPLLMAVSPPD